jgi:6-phosphogluconolactonase
MILPCAMQKKRLQWGHIRCKEGEMPIRVYVPVAAEDKITIWTIGTSGALERQGAVPLAGGPSPLAVDPSQQYLYVGLRASHQMASMRIDAQTGGLSLLGTVPLESDPCFISVDRSGRYLLASYYSAGHASVHAIGADGTVLPQPVEWLATAPKAHSIHTDRSNRYAYLPHVGESNRILQFVFDADTGHLTPNAVPMVVPPEGTGPRHYCYHPTLNCVYFDNEQASSVTAYHFNPAAGTLVPFQTLSTLPQGFDGPNTCAQIHITPSGQFLYAANRGHDSIACFRIDTSGGRMTALGQQATEPTPRTFGIDPQGRYLVAAGQGTGRLAAYRIKAEGTLEPIATYPVGERPMWVLILNQ